MFLDEVTGTQSSDERINRHRILLFNFQRVFTIMIDRQLFRHSQKAILTVLAISTLGLVSFPAQADEALIQETVQESYTTGHGNVSVQNSSQQNRQYSQTRGRRIYRDSNNVGIVQRSQQLCDQLGDGNACVQDARQSNTSRQRHSRH